VLIKANNNPLQLVTKYEDFFEALVVVVVRPGPKLACPNPS